MTALSRSHKQLIRQLTYRPQQRRELFVALELVEQARVLLLLSTHVQRALLKTLNNQELLPILAYVDPDDATDLLQLLPASRQKTLLTDLTDERQKDISLLLQFDPKTAAGLMSINYIQVEATDTVAEVADAIHLHEKRTGKFPIVLVLEQGKLIGYVPDHRLIFSTASDKISQYLHSISAISHTASSEKVLEHFLQHPHSKVAVLRENGAILGILYADDVLRIAKEQQGSNLYDFAGVNTEESVFDSIRKKVRSRYKWLIINLGTAFLAAFTVSLFEDTISKYVLLAVYMPIVAGMGGNAATQTLAVLVRGIALHQIDLATAMPALRRELGAALVNGVINGLLVAAIVLMFNRDLMIALVLAMAMVVNLLVAGFFGTLIPLIMTKLGKDPATSATIFITTATDVLGFLAFLGLATILLR